MPSFTKQFIFILLAGIIVTSGVLVIRGATPGGNMKIDPDKTAKIRVVKQENATTTGNSPVGWWKMDEGAGQYVYDSSGNGYTGTLGTSTSAEPADPTWTSAKLGKGLSFDGISDYVNVGDIPALRMNYNSFSISFWAKSLTNNSGVLIYKGNADASSKGYRIVGHAALFWRLAISDGINPTIYTPSSVINLSDNTWHYATFVVDRENSQIKAFKDGVQVGGNVSISAIGSNDIGPTGSAAGLTISRNGIYSGYFITGFLDDVRIYDRALSAGDVAQLYNSTKDGYLGNVKVSTGLVGYWKLDDNAANSTVIDYSGKRNNGTTTSGTATSTSAFSTTTAMIGRAMSFDGSNDYIIAGDVLNQTTNDFTISGWIKSASTAVTLGIINKRSYSAQTNAGYVIQLESDNKLHVYLCDGSTTRIAGVSSSIFADNEWHFFSVVFDRNRVAQIYRDGIANGSVSISAQQGSLTNNINFTIGTLYNGTVPANYFNGLLDEVKIWNYARTAEDIYEDYVRGTMHRP